ncbi:MAG: sterol desaturase family protein [Bacteroidia bacterium]
MEIFLSSLVALFVLGVAVEYYLTRNRIENYYDGEETRCTFKMAVAGLALDLLVKSAALYFLYKLSGFAFFALGYQWWVWLLCFIAWDFVFYLKHLSEHHVRFLWAIHVNHHSSKFMNLSVALRAGVLKSVYRYFFWAPLILAGFPFFMFLIIYSLGKCWAYIQHTQLIGRLGFLEKMLITPSHHRVHHSSAPENYNKNLGETLLIWDKMFGTFKEVKGELEYGIDEDIPNNDFLEATFHEMKKIFRDMKAQSSVKNKLKILFGKP